MYFVFQGTTCRVTGDTVELVVQELIKVSLELLLNYWINLASLEYTILNIFFIITKLNPKDSNIKTNGFATTHVVVSVRHPITY